mmetsp:Transcript_16271/g.41231  ORF Transcript_16271/g.41231 Transcript_16271/m.41231 type:complete len:235 (+) Transcript_16271:238-942(+)
MRCIASNFLPSKFNVWPIVWSAFSRSWLHSSTSSFASPTTARVERAERDCDDSTFSFSFSAILSTSLASSIIFSHDPSSISYCRSKLCSCLISSCSFVFFSSFLSFSSLSFSFSSLIFWAFSSFSFIFSKNCSTTTSTISTTAVLSPFFSASSLILYTSLRYIFSARIPSRLLSGRVGGMDSNMEELVRLLFFRGEACCCSCSSSPKSVLGAFSSIVDCSMADLLLSPRELFLL